MNFILDSELDGYLKRMQSLKKDCQKFEGIEAEHFDIYPCGDRYYEELEDKYKRIEHKAAILFLIHNWEKRNFSKKIDYFLIVKANKDKIHEMETIAKEDHRFGFDFNNLDDDEAILKKLQVPIFKNFKNEFTLNFKKYKIVNAKYWEKSIELLTWQRREWFGNQF